MLSGRGTISSCDVNVPSVYGVGEQHFGAICFRWHLRQNRCDAGFLLLQADILAPVQSISSNFKWGIQKVCHGCSELATQMDVDSASLESWMNFFTSLMPCLHHFLLLFRDASEVLWKMSSEARSEIQKMRENIQYKVWIKTLFLVCVYIWSVVFFISFTYVYILI